ncbi:YheC/YheD family protein [Cohnella pontilimi]|uniref:YheC/YheD family protein n=1 Tax=Cohnella pontilimi TaxID=2564100 RepID=A0A4U0FAD7_9BACL|nr:YheC/YheD family protein [Cohnella pontilimi]TJY41488.1 YheC/YheD family protein [Cohnella pontilimi]
MLDEAFSHRVVIKQSADKPVVAILTIEDDVQLFRGNRRNFADLIRTGESMGITTYVVTVKNLKLKSARVLGYTYRQEDQAWVASWFPRPGIVYNRIPLREDERLPHVQRKLSAIGRQPGMRLFNRRFFNKWSLFKWLNEHSRTRRYIPETKKLTEPAVLQRLLKRHELLYLKPVRGKAGVGIMAVSIEQEKPLPYRLQIQDDKGSRTYRLSSLEKLWERVCKHSDSIGEAYIAQQGIRLASVQDRPFDLRALVQKNGSGRWELTGMGARVAGDSSITTHVPRGGNIEDPQKLLSLLFGEKKTARVLRKVRRAAVILAKQIERASRSRLAEMSMDLGVDERGEVWFFEANSKPMKFDESHIRNKSLERIFQYCLFLHRRRLQARKVTAASEILT